MADVSEIPDGSELTAAQCDAMISRISLNIYNIMAGKWDALDHAEFGAVGKKVEPTKLLAELREQLKLWKDLRAGFDTYEEISVYDDPYQ